jgi:uncharacterized protein YegP (UPF0339 family)
MGRPRKKPPVARVEVYKDKSGEYRWRGLASNGEPVSESGEGYHNRSHAKKMAASLNAGARIEIVE